MARIKVTGYIDTDDLSPEEVDLNHEMGISNLFYDKIMMNGVTVYEIEDIRLEG